MKYVKWALPACALLLAPIVSAVPIYLNPPGQVDGSPANPTLELSRLNSAIITYNAAKSASLPAAIVTDLTPLGVDEAVNGGQFKTPSGPTSITLDFSLEHETYLMLKWGGIDEFFYVGNETGSFTFISDVHPTNPHTHLPNLNASLGLSHYDLFDPILPPHIDVPPPTTTTGVPDGGSSLVLLGLGLTGISAMVRRMRKA